MELLTTDNRSYEWMKLDESRIVNRISCYVPGAATTQIQTGEWQNAEERWDARRLEALQQAGLIQWNGSKLKPIRPVAKVEGEKTVAELIIEDRQ